MNNKNERGKESIKKQEAKDGKLAIQLKELKQNVKTVINQGIKAIKNANLKTKITTLAGVITVAAISVGLIVTSPNKLKTTIDPEIAKSMEYNEVQPGEEKVTGTDYVEFDAFFLRDLDGDGTAESIRGTCREIGKEDTLYMNLNVLTNGYLKDGKITINGENFYLQTAIPKDSEIKENVIGNDIKQINLNNIGNGTQKLLTGMVRSGDYSYSSKKAAAIGNDTSKYSKVNSVTLTGTHVADDEAHTETKIEKTVYFAVDWHGEVQTQITNINQDIELIDAVNREENTLNLNFSITTEETQQQLILKKSVVEGIIPQFNGYSPIKVQTTDSNIEFNYDETTRKFTITRQANQSTETGIVENSVSNYNTYHVFITYPLEAYDKLGTNTIQIEIPVMAYYEGYNNPNREFTNPKKSNKENANIIATYSNPKGDVAIFGVKVGKNVYTPTNRYIVSKEKPLNIYNGVSREEKQDNYTVMWYGATGTEGNTSGMIMKETEDENAQVTDQFIKTDATEISMEPITANIGIYFSNPTNMLGEEGWIKVYDDQTDELLATFTKENWNSYSSNYPFKYKTEVKHVRVETSSTKAEKSLNVYHIKQLNDEYITSHYTKEEFNNLQYIKSTLAGYLGKNHINTDIGIANYEAPYSIAKLEISKETLSTQITEKNMNIKIVANADENANQAKWLNGAFLLKLPQDILDIEINNVTSSNENVKIVSYEQYKEEEINYIKVNTKNDIATTFNINISCNITPDPRIETRTESLELYAYNQKAPEYFETLSKEDIYDVNSNLNKEEKVAYHKIAMNLIAPNSLLTSQTISNYDNKESITVAPQVAILQKEQRTANINIEINNNYTSTISNVVLLGRIPFEGNQYVINNEELGSNYTTNMQNTGIVVPEPLKSIAKIYYSENEEASKDLQDTSNGWTLEPTDFSKVKSYLIDLGEHKLAKGEKHTFTYTVNVPQNLNYNQVAYSHYAAYFSLDTEEGTYNTQTEPNKVGLMIAKQYHLELTKFQEGKEKTVEGATYSIVEDGQEEAKTKVTASNGKLTLSKLYVDRTYIVKEIQSPTDYELNADEIKFRTWEENGTLKVEVVSGNVKNIQAINAQQETAKIAIEVEDEVKANVKIVKVQTGTNNLLKGIRFNLTGKNFENGRMVTTNANGEITVKGLTIGETYTLEEVKAEGYYLITNPIKFTITNNNGTYHINVIEGTVNQSSITEENSIPTANLKIANDKIPTYNLVINKVVKGETTALPGAKFRLYKGTQKLGDYIADSQGRITINNLYQYETARNIDQTYTLKETYAPDGYAAVKDITFKVEKSEGLLTMDVQEGIIKGQTANNDTVTITIEDSPSFKLIKKDGETGKVLPNTKFAIYNVDNGTETIALDAKYNILGTKEIINGKEYYTLTTNEKGELTANLRQGLYKAYEVKASDDKYDITDNVYYFGIGASRETKEAYAPVWEMETDYKITDIAATEDGGFLLVGFFDEPNIQLGEYTFQNQGERDGIIVKYNKNKQVEWATSLGTSEDDYISSIIATKDEGFLIKKSGFVNNILTHELIKYNSNYEIEWRKEDNSITEKIKEDSNGDFLVISYNKITQYDKNANLKWSTTIGEANQVELDSLTTTEDGGFIVSGSFSKTLQIGSTTLTSNNRDQMIIKYNSNHEIEWFRQIGGKAYIQSTTVNTTSDGGYITTANFHGNIVIGEKSFTFNNSAAGVGSTIVIKYNSQGEVEWTSHIESIGLVTDIAETKEHKYLVNMQKMSSDDIKIGDYFAIANGNILIEYENNGKVNNIISNTYNFKIVTLKEGNVLTLKDSNGMLEGNRVEKLENKLLNNPVIINSSNFGGDRDDTIEAIQMTEDGGYLVKARLNSKNVTIGEQTINNTSMPVYIKYNSNNQIEEITTNQYIANPTLKVQTKDGGYITANEKSISKYNNLGVLEWEKVTGNIGDTYYTTTCMAESKDGGYIVGGYFNGTVIQIGAYTLTAIDEYTKNGIIIKYDSKGTVQWAKGLKADGESKITAIAEKEDGTILVGGYFQSNTLQVDGENLTNNGGKDAMLLSLVNYTGVPDVQELTVENDKKQLKITTDVQEVDGIKGGTITGEDQIPFETVTYGENSTKSIIMKPDSGYAIISITVNGEEYSFTKNADGSYTMPSFTNMQENKHIVVTYSDKDVTEKPKLANVIVHHYLKDKTGNYTTIKVAEDEIMQGEVGTKYTTKPYLDLEKYQLEKDAQKEYVMPQNYTGNYTQETIEITYYYEIKDIPLTVYHYIEGTKEPVVLRNGQKAPSQEYIGKEGESYNTNSLTKEELNPKYELVKMPENSTGKYDFSEVEVIYYYKVKESAGVIVHHIDTDTKEKIANDVILPESGEGKYGDSYTTQQAQDLPVDYEYVTKTENWEGSLIDSLIEVTYEYKLKYDIKITKTEAETEEPIKNVQFLVKGDGTENTYTTNVIGDITIPNLNFGETYTIKEIYAKGYYVDETEFTVKLVHADGKLQVEYNGRTPKKEPNIVQKEGSKATVQIELENVSIPKYSLELTKVGEKTGNLLEGAEFEITGAGRDEQEEQKYVTAQNGKLTIENLYENEEYILKETVAPAGYQLSETPVKFKATQQNGIWSFETMEGAFKEDPVVEGKEVKATWEDKLLFKLEKKDEETGKPLQGAKFTIESLEGVPATDVAGNILGNVETIDGKEMYVVTTDEDGMLIMEIAPGVYKVTEVQAPFGYNLPENPVQYFGIDASAGEKMGAKVISAQTMGLGTTDNASVMAIVKTKDKGYIVGVDFTSTLQVGTTTLEANETDAAIIKYNSNQEVQWVRHITGATNQNITAIAELANGDIAVVGYFKTEYQIGEQKLQSSGISPSTLSLNAGVVAVLSSNGECKNSSILRGRNIITAGRPDGSTSSSTRNTEGENRITAIAATNDGGFAIAGWFENNTVVCIGNDVNGEVFMGETLTNNSEENARNKNKLYSDAIIAKYNNTYALEWSKSIAGTNEDRFDSIAELTDGTIVAGGNFYQVQIGEENYDYYLKAAIEYNQAGEVQFVNEANSLGYQIKCILPTENNGYLLASDLGKVAKYGPIIEIEEYQARFRDQEWEYMIGDEYSEIEINSIEKTNEGGYIITGGFNEESIKIGEDILTNNSEMETSSQYYTDGFIAKLNEKGNPIWAKAVGGNKADQINTAIQLENGKYLVGGSYASSTIELDENTLTTQDYASGMLLELEEVVERGTIAQAKEIVFQDSKKTYNITTEVQGVGGTISGQNETPYEEVKYQADSTKDIIITPQSGYAVSSITINGENTLFTQNEDGTVNIDKFTNMEEDKHIVVTFTANPAQVIVHHYKDGTEEKVAQDDVIHGEVEKEYQANAKQDLEKYTVVEEKLPTNANGTMTEETIEVIYYYQLKDTKVIVHHYKEGTQEKVAEDEQIEGKVDDSYTTHGKTNLSNYNIVESKLPENATGTMTAQTIEVTYYYNLKDAKVIVKYLEQGTENELANQEQINGKVGEEYNTTNLEKQIKGFSRTEEIPNNKQGNMTPEDITVIYYYTRIPVDMITNTIQKEGTNHITNEDEKLTYHISYLAEIANYMGTAKITVTDKLPFEIDEKKSNIMGGVYNALNKTITWEETIENIDTYENGNKQVEIQKQIEVVYTNMDYSKTTFENKVIGKIALETTKQEIETSEAKQETKTEFLKDVTVSKKWNHTNNAYYYPRQIVVQVKNGENVVDEQEITKANRVNEAQVGKNEEIWRFTFTDLPKYDENGVEINYTVDEKEVKNGDLAYYQKILDQESKTIINNYVGPVITSKKEVTTQNGLNYVVEGEKVTYKVVVENAGSIAKEVVIKDTIPEGLTLVAGSIKVNGSSSYTLGSGETEKVINLSTKTATDLANGLTINVPSKTTTEDGETTNGKVELTFETTVDSLLEEVFTKELKNTATVDEKETNEVTTTVNKSNLRFEKISTPVSGSKVKVGDEITYTIKLSNTRGTIPITPSVKDTIPEGTTFVEGSIKVDGNSSYILGEETIELSTKTAQDLSNGLNINLAAGEAKELSFKVKVAYSREESKQIKNIAYVNEKPTNETVVEYQKEQINLETTLTKTGNEKVTNITDKVDYQIAYTAKVDSFVGKAVIKLVDKLPYAINDTESNLDGGIYNKEDNTITWEQTVEDIDTYTANQEKTIEINKVVSLKYNYPNEETLNGSFENMVTTTTQLKEPTPEDVENPEKTVKTDEKQANHEVTVEVPAMVIVHHYIYDSKKDEYTTVKVPSKTKGKVVEDETKQGLAGDSYTTTKSNEVAANYTVVNETPEKHEGTMTKTPIEVIYYYRLEEAQIITNNIEKDGSSKITKEGEKVTYNLIYTGEIAQYIGNAKVTIVDKLPYEIDEAKSNLMGGVYNAAQKTITWEETIENIDTYENGNKQIQIAKQMELTYVNVNYGTESFENKVKGKLALEITKQEQETNEATKVTELEFIKDILVTKVWNHTNNSYTIPNKVKVQLKNGETVVEEKVLTREENKVEESTEEGSATDKSSETNSTLVNNTETWNYTFVNLPKYDSEGNEINYTVEEVAVETGDLIYYNSSIEQESKTITNTYVGPVITSKKEVTTQNSLNYVIEGEKVTYKVIVENAGSIAKEVVIKDNIPEGLTLVAGSIKVNGSSSYTLGSGETEKVINLSTKTATDLANGLTVNVPSKTITEDGETTNGKVELTFETTVDTLQEGVVTKKLKNIAVVDETETNETTIIVNKSNVVFEKTVTPEGKVFAGDELTYSIKAFNNGSLAKTIKVQDTIPEGTTLVEGSIKVEGLEETARKTYTQEQLEQGIDVTIKPNGEITLSFTVTVNIGATGDIKNKATVDEEQTNEVTSPVVTFEKKAEITRKTMQTLPEGAVTVNDEITYTIVVRNTGTKTAESIQVKDTIPEGTILKEIGNEGTQKENKEITWNIESIPAGETKELSFTVKVGYSKEESKQIKNIAYINKKPTNETVHEYQKPEIKLETTIEKTGDEKITTTDAKVYYEIAYTAKVNSFVGKAVIKLVDKLPYAIDEEKSELDGGKYNAEDNTITWEQTVENIDNYTTNQEKGIAINKAVSLKYSYPNEETLSGTIENTVTATTQLKEPNPEDAENLEKTVKTDEKQDDHEVLVELPTRVMVHHYIYDAQKEQYTTIKVPAKTAGEVVEDETKQGLVGDSYTTSKSNKTASNYVVVNETPEKHEGTMTKTPIEVIYYYQLIDETVTSSIEKTAKADKTVEKVEVLTTEDGKIDYQIVYKVSIKDYLGKAKVSIVDTLPAAINSEKSNLNGGTYNAENNTITWEETIENIDTFADGAFETTITKNISLVYEGQNKAQELVNTVNGTVVTYYPQNHIEDPENPNKEKQTQTVEDKETVKQEYKVDKTVEKVWDDNENAKGNRPVSVRMTLTANGQPVVKNQTNDNLNNNEATKTNATIKTETQDDIRTLEGMEQLQNNVTFNEPTYETIVLSKENSWKHTFTNLPKYDNLGNEIAYSVEESEVTLGDLEYYEAPQIVSSSTTNKIVVTNSYKLINTTLDSTIVKDGTEKITASKQEVNYHINYNATITDYIGEATVTIVDTLPYEIDVAKSNLNGGTYDETSKTITWVQKLGHINTTVTNSTVSTNNNEESIKDTNSAANTANSYQVNIDKNIKVVYKNLDKTAPSISNSVKGKIEFTQNDTKNEVTDTHETLIELKGNVVVKYVDKDTGEEITYEIKPGQEGNENGDKPITKTYGYEIEDKVQTPYETEQKEIYGYTYVENSGNTTGNIVEGTTYVIYYYTKTKAADVTVKYVDEDGNEIAKEEIIKGNIGDPYETEKKEIETYEFVEVTGDEPEGTMTETPKEVIYHYKKAEAKVIVKHLEKGTDKELAISETINGKVGDNYQTERKVIEGYKKANPEPTNAVGKMKVDKATNNTIYVTYYYERIPSGKVTVKYVDIDTKQEIIYTINPGQEGNETGKDPITKTYGYEISGKVGEKYKTEEKQIPYYKYVKEAEPTNKEGTYTQNDETVIYYYKKLPFNFSVDKIIKEATQDGKLAKVNKEGKIIKMEIVASKLKQTTIQVKYAIIVKNEGEIEGTATVKDLIPAGFKVANSNPSYWEVQKDGSIVTKVDLKVGETKELEVVLDWKASTNNLGIMKNIAQIIDTKNPAGYNETTIEDNNSDAEVVLSIKTGAGAREKVLATALGTIAICGTLILAYQYQIYQKQRKTK